MKMPQPRGPLSSAVIAYLAGGYSPGAATSGDAGSRPRVELAATARGAADSALGGATDILTDEDIQLGLYVMYELRYFGFDDAADTDEWDPTILELCARIEAVFEAELRRRVPVPDLPTPSVDAVAAGLFELAAADTGPSVSRYVAKKATHDQLAEFLIQRSIYQLKEADPHSWAIPRLQGRAKAALVEIQADEYGGGRPARMHSALFARTLRGLGLNDAPGYYVDHVPAITLASLNMMTMFGTHRRLRGAIAGHLAAFEMTSSGPNRLYGNGFRRLGHTEDVTFYFDEHVEADAVHEQIAARDLAGGLVEDEPTLLADVLFGAASCLFIDGLAGRYLLDAWESGVSSLRGTALAEAGSQ